MNYNLLIFSGIFLILLFAFIYIAIHLFAKLTCFDLIFGPLSFMVCLMCVRGVSYVLLYF